MKYIIFLSLGIISFSCDRERPVGFEIGEPIMVVGNLPKETVGSKMKYRFSKRNLYQDIKSINLNQIKKYGSFYTKEFTIYQIKNLDLLEDLEGIEKYQNTNVESTPKSQSSLIFNFSTPDP